MTAVWDRTFILMIRLILLSWLSVAATLGVAQVPIEKKESNNFMFYFLRGEELFKAKAYSEALVNYNESINIYPYYPEAYFSRAVIRERLNDQEGALRDYNIFLELKPDQFDALFSRALLLFNQKKWDLAKKDFTRLLTLPAGETNTIYYRQDLFTENVNRVFTTQGSNHAYIFNYVGLTHMELKDFDNALICFDSATYYNPNDADYYVNTGRCYESMGKVEEARISYLTAIEINPNHGLAKHNLSIINRNSGDSSGADGILEEVISKHPTLPYPYAERALTETNRGEFRKALRDYDEAIRLAPTEAEYRLGRGIVKEKLKDWAGAYDDFTEAIHLNEKLEKAWLNRANLLYKRGQYVEAIKDYDIALLLSDSYGIAFYNRALAKNKLGRDAEACEDLKNARSLGFDVRAQVFSKICGVQ